MNQEKQRLIIILCSIAFIIIKEAKQYIILLFFITGNIEQLIIDLIGTELLTSNF